ncbi:hypothetical protein OGAPHI_000243 [Ogataea philodendri]|uniref:Mitochondrial inner membrane i-AAA protease supercomplex subunit MGR3 n=1 Tax=Ogataea philodendri TaxID=1378263 RepID=A0A9P8TAN8_9ASCO|nr:uncharacterized protein OGAPHI_000243 [Ogataea philodendri]KAH3671540.1 hypothetical protein OGAPHI_000243 [Ogataea philodendri]
MLFRGPIRKSLRAPSLRNWAPLLHSRLISQQDISKNPSLNQFQDPNRPPPQSAYRPPFTPSPVPQTPNEPRERSPLTSVITIGLLSWLVYRGFLLYEEYEDTTYSAGFEAVLTEALTAENEGNFAKALKLYSKCLSVADKEGTSQLDQHYTGAVLKVAEMYEKLDDFDHALAIYKDLSEFLLSQIGNPEVKLSQKKRDMLIQQSLVVSMRYCNLLKPSERQEIKQLLLDNILIAERRIIEHYPPFLVLLYDQLNRSVVDFITAGDDKFAKLPPQVRNLVKDGMVVQLAPQPGPEMSKIPKELKLLITAGDAWLPFVKELVSLRDLCADICISEGSLQEAAFYLRTNLLLMQSSIDEPGKLSLTLTKMGVVFYLLSEQYAKQAKMLGDTDEKVIFQELSRLGFKTKNGSSPDEFGNAFIRMRDSAYTESEASFEQVLELTSMIRSASFGTETDLPEFVTVGMHLAEMISSCGLAMHMLRKKDYEESKKFFLRARVLALKYDVDDYLADIDHQLAQLNKLST